MPSTLKPGGSSVTRSPWLIHTGYFSPFFHTPSNSGDCLRHLDLGAAELAVMAALDLAAELLRHRLLAVADAEHRHAGVDRSRAARSGASLSSTEAGPPDRITAFGLHRGERLLAPSGTARSRNRPPPRARAARSAASPASRNRRSESCRAGHVATWLRRSRASGVANEFAATGLQSCRGRR